MTQIRPYLTFSGNCREAMLFYKDCLGGELAFQTVGESPLAEKMPAQMKDCILHATLTKGELLLLATDMVHDGGINKGNTVSLMLNCGSEEEIRNAYQKLGEGGKSTRSLEITFWGALFGDLVDKFENNWVLHFDKADAS